MGWDTIAMWNFTNNHIALTVSATDGERRDPLLRRFCSYFNSVKGQNTIYFAKYVMCEFLNVVVLALNFSVTDAFISTSTRSWGSYGFEGSDSMV